jgi:NADH-quinone oxidoreductase subunit M
MLLSLLIFVPLLGALGLLVLPSDRHDLMRAYTLVVTLVVAALGVALWFQFDSAVAIQQLTETRHWFLIPYSEAPGYVEVHYALGVDGISILLVALTAFLMPLVVLSTPGHVKHRVKEFLVWLLVMQTGMMGVFLAMDLVLFYTFWEVSLVPLYFMLGIWGGDRRLYATVKFFLYTVAGSLVMLIAAVWMYLNFHTTSIPELTELAAASSLEVQGWLFAAFALAFAIKVPVIPFHTWLADAHTEAPTSGSVLLAGVLLKMGTYGLLRFGIGMFPQAAVESSTLFMILGAVGIVYGAFLAMAQTDVKRLVACSSVSHLGYVVLGMFALTQSGLRGSLLQMVNHGLSTGLLFLLIGMIYERRHTRELKDYGGVAAVMPIFAFFFVFAVLSSVGLPGLNGFIGEWMILLGSFQANPWLASIAVTGVIFGAVYLLRATRLMLFGEVTNEANQKLQDLNLREVGLMVPIVVLCVWIGVKPNTFLDRTTASLDLLAERVEEAQKTLELGAAEATTEVPR